MSRSAALLLLVLATGCYRHALVVSGTTPEEEASYGEWRHELLFGIVSFVDETDLRAVCPQGVSRVETEMDLLNAMLATITVGLYTPSRLYVYCHAPTEGIAAPQ